MLKIIKASKGISFVDAAQPINGGKAPGIAPTNTAIGPTFLRGVYKKV